MSNIFIENDVWLRTSCEKFVVRVLILRRKLLLPSARSSVGKALALHLESRGFEPSDLPS